MHDKNKALEPIEFIQMLNLVDDFYGQPFLLLDWQHNILWDVYGNVNDNGFREYRYAYLEIPKKNGKTSLIAAIALYHLTCDSEGGQIYCCAADRGQAELVYKAACGMREQNKQLKKILKLTDSRKEIKNIITGTTLKVLSAEAYTKHGINPTVVIFDELHCQPNRDLWDVMTFGAGAARKEPLWWVITTAGDDPDRHSIGWEQHEYARRVRDCEIIDPTWYVKIYGASDDADIWDEDLWYEVNPSLGKAFTIEKVREEALRARNSESAEKLFRWLRLNQWVSLKKTGWLPLTLWDTTTGKWAINELVGCRCYGGLDLSSTTDLTALCLLFPPQKNFKDWRAIFEVWIPQDNIKERVERDHAPYDKWAKNKYLHTTPGNVIDYDFIEARVKSLKCQYEIKMLGCDPYNATQLMINIAKHDIPVSEVAQRILILSPAMKEIERLMKTKSLTHEQHPVARWCFGNMTVYVDGNENLKPLKNRSMERIDVAMAFIDAMHTAMQCENTKNTCPYSAERGILVV